LAEAKAREEAKRAELEKQAKAAELEKLKRNVYLGKNVEQHSPLVAMMPLF
jgi:hypothetical protein